MLICLVFFSFGKIEIHLDLILNYPMANGNVINSNKINHRSTAFISHSHIYILYYSMQIKLNDEHLCDIKIYIFLSFFFFFVFIMKITIICRLTLNWIWIAKRIKRRERKNAKEKGNEKMNRLKSSHWRPNDKTEQ